MNRIKLQLVGACLVFAPVAAQAQYTITGDVKGLADGTKVYLQIRGTACDSACVEKGKFVLKGGNVDVSYCTLLSADHQFGAQFWLSNDDIRLTGEVGKGGAVTGAPEEDFYTLYTQHMTPLWDTMRAMQAESKKALEQGDRQRMEEINNRLNTEMRLKEDSTFLAFADQHPAAYICMNHIYNRRVMDKYSFKRYNAMLQHLKKGAFKGRQWDTLMEIYQTDQRLEPGNPFPAITLKDVYDTDISLADYKGKYTLVTFGLGGIKEYQAGVPFRKSLYEQYQAKGFEMVDILFESGKEAMMKAASTLDISWNLISDFKGWNTPLVHAMGIDRLCQSFLLDPQGIILGRNLTDEELSAKLKELF